MKIEIDLSTLNDVVLLLRKSSNALDDRHYDDDNYFEAVEDLLYKIDCLIDGEIYG